jgi:hypothetical protein
MLKSCENGMTATNHRFKRTVLTALRSRYCRRFGVEEQFGFMTTSGEMHIVTSVRRW